MIIEEKQNNQDVQAPKELALRLRKQDIIIVSPIDLSVERTETLIAEQLQWLNFYEPPLRLSLKNSGDTVMIRGQWANRQQRPTLTGGPLDGYYVFSQAHFHWGCPNHQHAKHTIDGKSNTVEMHSLFYKTSYHSQEEAQEKEDGIVIVVYFFKVEKRSSFKWMTDQLERVITPKASLQLPSAPLCALMVPFTKDYLAYWAALACTCHHVLWLVSRTPLWITEEEILQFGKVQSNRNERIDNRGLEIVKTANHIYQINPSRDSLEVLYPDAIDPPCQISTPPTRIIIAVDYLTTSNTTANNISGDKSNHEIYSQVSLPNYTSQDKGSSAINSDSKLNSLTWEINAEKLCSKCKISAVHLNSTHKFNHKFPRKRFANFKRNVMESKKISNVKMIEEDTEKNLVKFSGKEEDVRKLSGKDKEEIEEHRNALNNELTNLTESGGTGESIESTNDVVVDEVISSTMRIRNPIQKSVHTSKPKSVSGEINELHNDRENLKHNNKLITSHCGKSPNSVQRETTGNQSLVKDKQEIEKKAKPPKSKPPLIFSPWKSDGLSSSLIPLFSGNNIRRQSEKRTDSSSNNTKISTQTPKVINGKKIANRTKPPQHQDLGGKGDQNSNHTRIIQQKPHLVSVV